jgi:hypothetical protein
MGIICRPSCVTGAPATDWANGCEISVRDGGIPRLTFLVCDNSLVLPNPALLPDGSVDPNPNANPWTNPANVIYAMCQNKLFVTGDLLGQKPKGSFNKRRMTSCAPETTISGSKQITFQDFNANKETLVDFDFWQAIEKNKRFMYFGWVTCDDRWYQFDGDWDLEIDEVIEDTSEGKSFYDGTVTMSTKELVKPIICPGLLDALAAFNTTTSCTP